MALELGLAGKVALITGGSEGLGRAIAERLATERAKVSICARRQEPLDQARQEIKAATGQDVLAVPADVTVPGDLERLVSATTERFGDIDILVNNAGRSAAQSLLVADDAYWQEDLDLKLMAAIRLTRLVVPSMRRVGGGAIINMTTPGGKSATSRIGTNEREPGRRHCPDQGGVQRVRLRRYPREYGLHWVHQEHADHTPGPSCRPAGGGAVRGSGLERAAGPHRRS